MKILKKLLIISFLLLLSGAFVTYLGWQKIITARNISASEVMISRGDGLNKIANTLETQKVVDNAMLFVWFMRASGLANQIKAGEYDFSGQYSLIDVANKLVKGEVIVRSVTIPEGKVLAEIKDILMKNQYLSGDITLELQEGEVLPETYHFNRGESRDEILKRARLAMKNVLNEAFDNRDVSVPLKSANELLILASIVEKETGLPEERAKVASVFVNRLHKGMLLQTDPTVIYAVTQGQMNLGRPIYKKDLTYDSPYNTYVYAGLPPTPICSPGKAAILAAANPDKTPYIYFVADGVTGGHRFASTLSEHNQNVAHYRRSLH